MSGAGSVALSSAQLITFCHGREIALRSALRGLMNTQLTGSLVALVQNQLANSMSRCLAVAVAGTVSWAPIQSQGPQIAREILQISCRS